MQIDVPFIQIEPTTRCNFTCGFCAGRHLPQTDLDFELFRGLVDQLKNPLHIELQGEGEPLLHPQFFAMTDYVRMRFPSVKISTITNGSLFTDDNIDRLLNTRINSLMVSLESPDELAFQHIRGGKLERVKRGVKKLMQRKRDTASAFPSVGLTVTLLQSTCERLEAIADLYDELELDGGILLQPLQTMRTYTQFYSAETAAEILSREKVQVVNQIIASSVDLRLKLQEYQKQSHFYADLYRSTQNQTCPWLENGLYLAADGALMSCCFIKDSQQYSLGSAGEHWEQIAANRKALASQLTEGPTPPQCRHCGIAQKMHAARTAKPTTAQSETSLPHE